MRNIRPEDRTAAAFAQPWYRSSYRRILTVLHIPDWDQDFLSRYDPEISADLYAKAGVTSEVFMAHSHVGLCLWPTKAGKMHACLRGRDILREQVQAVRKRNIRICVYYSVHVNDWAFLEHPEWRMQPAGAPPATAYADTRWARVCPNHPEYRAFVMAQARELAEGYDLDGMFFDMVFWPTVCVCPHCRLRYMREAGKEVPQCIDWHSDEWCAFQAARERWMTELAHDLRSHVKGIKPTLSVYHNFAPAFFNWTVAQTLDSAVHHDYLGADYYGDPLEQLQVSKTAINLANDGPAEFMVYQSPHLRDYARLKPHAELRMQALAAVHQCSALMVILEPRLDGSPNARYLEKLGEIYAETAPYEPYLRGKPVEDVAVYLSSDSKMTFLENGQPLAALRDEQVTNRFPHMAAVRGACRVLQEAHVPFGIITRKQLTSLNDYQVVVLPNALRMDKAEARAFLEYVRQGGRLYASRYTSLTETCGVRHKDFMLADAFGCHFAGDDIGEVAYMLPAEAAIAAAVSPQEYLSLFPQMTPFHPAEPEAHRSNALRLDPHTEGTVLGTLTLPYDSGKGGTVFDRDWSSIHNAPPWRHTDAPVLVRNSYGTGEAVYCAADIEAIDAEGEKKLFIHLVRSLLRKPLSFTADAHPAVWMSAYHDSHAGRVVVGFLNYQRQLPPVPVEAFSFTLRLPAGERFTRLLMIPGEVEQPFTLEPDGTLHAEVRNLRDIRMLVAEMI